MLSAHPQYFYNSHGVSLKNHNPQPSPDHFKKFVENIRNLAPTDRRKARIIVSAILDRYQAKLAAAGN